MRPHPRRTRVDPSSPRAWGTSDGNGMIGQHENMQWQWDWAGSKLVNKRILLHPDELDEPQRQLGTIVLPPDPPTVMDARPEQYNIEEIPISTRYTLDKNIRVTVGSTPGQRAEPNQRVVVYRGLPATVVAAAIPLPSTDTGAMNFSKKANSMMVMLVGPGI